MHLIYAQNESSQWTLTTEYGDYRQKNAFATQMMAHFKCISSQLKLQRNILSLTSIVSLSIICAFLCAELTCCHSNASSTFASMVASYVYFEGWLSSKVIATFLQSKILIKLLYENLIKPIICIKDPSFQCSCCCWLCAFFPPARH